MPSELQLRAELAERKRAMALFRVCEARAYVKMIWALYVDGKVSYNEVLQSRRQVASMRAHWLKAREYSIKMNERASKERWGS